jgi:hypothetical protein
MRRPWPTGGSGAKNKRANSAVYDSFSVTDWATFENEFTKTLRVEIISSLQICEGKMIYTWRPYALFYKLVDMGPLQW